MLLHTNDTVTPVKSANNGPEAGHVFPYLTRASIPIAYSPDAFERYWEGKAGVEAFPGMIVVYFDTNELYSIDVDGYAIALGMHVPGNYNDGARLGSALVVA